MVCLSPYWYGGHKGSGIASNLFKVGAVFLARCRHYQITFKILPMNKVLFSAMLLASVTSCENPKSASGQPSELVMKDSPTYYSIVAVDYHASGMHYKVFESGKGDIFVVNITKDSLEVKNKR